MEFRLSYRGPLRATQRDPAPGTSVLSKHWRLKHEMRQAFHVQLKKFWETNPTLSEADETDSYHAATLAAANQIPPWQFVPLITERLSLITGIDILLMRVDYPGPALYSGDTDNRIKTLIDALEMPGANDGYSQLQPGPDETPLFCLLENDKLLDAVSVERARLLDPPPANADYAYAHVLIKVTTRPQQVTWANVGL